MKYHLGSTPLSLAEFDEVRRTRSNCGASGTRAVDRLIATIKERQSQEGFMSAVMIFAGLLIGLVVGGLAGCTFWG